MIRRVFDLESTLIPHGDAPGIPDGVPDTLHCCCVQDVDTGEKWLFVDEEQWEPELERQCTEVGIVPDGFLGGPEMKQILEESDLLIGHNIARFDLPLLEAFYEWFLALDVDIYDTLAASRQIYQKTMAQKSFMFRRAVGGRSPKSQDAALPYGLCFSHSLEAWGYRLREPKGDFNDWSHLSLDMITYCAQDVNTNVKLFHRLLRSPFEHPISVGTKKKPKFKQAWVPTPCSAMVTESLYNYTLHQQELNGVGFDVEAAEKLIPVLSAERSTIKEHLVGTIRGRFVPQGKIKTAKKTMKSLVAKPGTREYKNYREGCEHQPLKYEEFNPASGAQIANHLMRDYGWQPDNEEYSTQVGLINGKLGPIPLTKSKEVLELLDMEKFPTLPGILRYKLLNKRLGTLAEGDKAFLKYCHAGKIHGKVNGSGARTSRASHHSPNVNVPKVGSPFGEEMRAMFRPTRKGWVQVGCDSSGLEMRCLSSRMARWDNGAFAETILSGEIHNEWMKSTGTFSRNHQKTFSYAMLYGAGGKKLGLIILQDWREALAKGETDKPAPALELAVDIGSDAKDALISNQEGFSDLMHACTGAFNRGYVVGLDGRCIKVGSEHGTLNDVLQSDGAIVMKTAKCLFVREVWAKHAWCHGRDFAWMLDVHDEWQLECPPENAEELGRLMQAAMIEAGVVLGMLVPLAAEYKIGKNWKDCH